MSCLDWLSVGGNAAAIATALVASFGYGFYRLDLRAKRERLENYLKKQKKEQANKGQRSLLHLTAKLGMTETELLQASFRSKRINRRVGTDKETGLANALLLEWRE